MRSGFRFGPPQQELSAELRWLFRRAFGPAGEVSTDTGDLDEGSVRDLAQRFDLAARVGARTRPESLVADVGSEAAQWFRQQHMSSAAHFLLIERVCHELAEIGRAFEIPLVFLKGAALQLGETVVAGSRNMGDVDVLAPKTGARRLQNALLEAGCTAHETRESEHQLQYLAHLSGVGIEVHKIIPGVRLEGRNSATADRLIEEGFVCRAPGIGDGCYIPNREMMLAHVLVHGIGQHGLSPRAYPMTRMLADVQDLGAEDHEWQNACRWIERDVSRDEVDAVASLVQRLGSGEDPEAVVRGADQAGALLRHVVAGLLDEGYLRSMKFRTLTAKPRDTGGVRTIAKTLQGAFLPTRAQIDILYGRPKTELGYWGWRLWRPFDLVVRSVRYGWAWVGQRLRGR